MKIDDDDNSDAEKVAMSSGTTLVAPFLLLCFMAGETAGERGSVRPPDECGDPQLISQSYEGYDGTMVEIVDGDTLVVDIHGWEIEDERLSARLLLVTHSTPHAPPL